MANPYCGNGVYLSRHFPTAYATRDLDRAAAAFQRQFGIRKAFFDAVPRS